MTKKPLGLTSQMIIGSIRIKALIYNEAVMKLDNQTEMDQEEKQEEFLKLSSSQKATDSCGSRLMECKTVCMCVCAQLHNC